MVRSKRNRKKHKHRLTIPLILVMAILLATITSASISAFEWLQALYLSHTYNIKGVTVKGNHRISSADILSAANLRVGTDSVHSIKAYIVEKCIKARFRRLERVGIQHTMDGWVTIAVKEREPIAFVADPRNADSFMVIDAHGFILEEGVRSPHQAFGKSLSKRGVGNFPHGDIPVVVGVIPDPVTGDALRVTGSSTLNLALDVLSIARSVVPELFGEISRLDARDADSIVLTLDTRWRYPVSSKLIVRIASDRIKKGLSDILPVITKRREEDRETKYIDARFHGAIYCSNSVSFDYCEGG